MTATITIVIPTHNRKLLLQRSLAALAKQDVDPSSFEIIVVADHCTDGTAEMVENLKMPCRLNLVQSAGTGAAATRNRGAAAATTPLILFLDDDMEASPGLVRAHLRCHEEHPGGVVIGYFPLAELPKKSDHFANSVKLWWDDSFSERARPGHRFTFRDLCTGNVSMPREAFEQAGGFDESYGRDAAGEDYDLGMQLLAQGRRFRYVPEAASIHHDKPSRARILGRANQEGKGHVILARKYPELFYTLRLGELTTHWQDAKTRRRWRYLWRYPWLGQLQVVPLAIVLKLAEALKLRSSLSKAFYKVFGYSYWLGVRERVPTIGEWSQMMIRADDALVPRRPIVLDLSEPTERLAEQLEREKPDAATLVYQGEPVGEIPFVPGAEPLRFRHIQAAIVDRFSHRLAELWQAESPKQTEMAPSAGWPPGHFYSPIPSLAEIESHVREIRTVPPTIPGVDLNVEGQLSLLGELAQFQADLPFGDRPQGDLHYGYLNPNFSYGEAASLSAMMRLLKPKKVVEIGSGHSTCVMADTNHSFFGDSIEITAIEPYPELLLTLLGGVRPASLRLLPKTIQTVDPSVFTALEPGDILFVDSSHVSKAGSDLNHILFEILPSLRPGVAIHFHDVFYPFEYPKEWILGGRFWNEVYLLHAFLLYNPSFQIDLFPSYLERFYHEELVKCIPLASKNAGTSLWLRRI